jgi:hypothetical protein
MPQLRVVQEGEMPQWSELRKELKLISAVLTAVVPLGARVGASVWKSIDDFQLAWAVLAFVMFVFVVNTLAVGLFGLLFLD